MTNTIGQREKLEACPFCGGVAISEHETETASGFTASGFYVWHVCDGCGVQSEGEDGHDNARAAWNRRAHPPSAGEEKTGEREEMNVLRAALEPFAAAYPAFSGLADSIEVRLDGSFKVQNRDAMLDTPPVSVTVGDLRRARDAILALSPTSGDQNR